MEHCRAAFPPTSTQQPSSVDLGLRVLCRLWHIIKMVNAAPALVLVVLAIVEALITSRIGTISSKFYQLFIDSQQSMFLNMMLWSAGCYAAAAAFYTVKASVQDFFAWRWRAALSCQLQELYCCNYAFYTLKGVDNPDQRLAQDLPLLTSTLADTLIVLAAAPFNVLWYTYLTQQVFGSWMPVAAAFVFFVTGAAVQRLAMVPVARLVFKQEAAEGAYRYRHMRLRTYAEEITMYRAAPVELRHLELQLARVLYCQGLLVLRKAALTATTKVLEYGGLIVNFGCIAVAVFSGAWDVEKQTAGGIAAKVSMASFYMLSLIYSFTQVLDLAGKVSSLAGLTARVGQMLEALAQLHADQPLQSYTAGCLGRIEQQQLQQQQHQCHTVQDQTISQLRQQQQQQQQQALQLLQHGRARSHERYASQAILLQPPELVSLNSSSQPLGPMQISIHSLGADLLLREVRRAFPDLPKSAPLLAAVTMQFCGSARGLMQQKLYCQYSAQQTKVIASDIGQNGCGNEQPGQQQPLQQQQHRFQQQAGQLPWQGPQQAAVQHESSSQQQAVGTVTLTRHTASSTSWQIGHSVSTASGHVHSQQQGAAAAARSSSCTCCEAATAAATTGAQAAAAAGSCTCSAGEMQQLLAVFLAWQEVVCGYLKARGCWADAIDPRTGKALNGGTGSAYDEVIGAQVLLRYDKYTPPGSSCPLIKHPIAGTQVYPATLFTSAPLPLLREALRTAAAPAKSAGSSASCSNSHSSGRGLAGAPCYSSISALPSARHKQQDCSNACAGVLADTADAASADSATGAVRSQAYIQRQPILACCSLSVSTPLGVPVVRGVNLQLSAADGPLLIMGPSGCGKSTLLKCLAGLLPADSGTFAIAAAAAAGQARAGAAGIDMQSMAGVMFVPQRTVAAPGALLREQLVYPAAANSFACFCSRLNSVLDGSCHTAGQVKAGSHCSSSDSCTISSRHSSWQWPGSASSRGDQYIPLPTSSNGCQQTRQPRHSVRVANWLEDLLTYGLLHNNRPQWKQWPSRQCSRQQRTQSSVAKFAAVPSSALATALPTSRTAEEHAVVQLCSNCQQLHQSLQQVCLQYLVAALPHGLDTACGDWGSVLSAGELQRLAIARVLLHRPVLAILDEPTSSLPDAEAIHLYQQMQAAGVTFVSVAHGSSLLKVHRWLLTIAADGEGSWHLSDLSGGT